MSEGISFMFIAALGLMVHVERAQGA